MAFSPSQQPRKRKIGEIAMADTPMTDMDEGSKGGRRSVLVFGLVAATLTVPLILVGVAGKNVDRVHWCRPIRRQPAVRKTRKNYQPAMSKSPFGSYR
jgi:hypothetical protein